MEIHYKQFPFQWICCNKSGLSKGQLTFLTLIFKLSFPLYRTVPNKPHWQQKRCEFHSGTAWCLKFKFLREQFYYCKSPQAASRASHTAQNDWRQNLSLLNAALSILWVCWQLFIEYSINGLPEPHMPRIPEVTERFRPQIRKYNAS